MPNHRALLLLALTAAVLVEGKIHHSVVDKDERQLIPLTEAFGFADGGQIHVTIRAIDLLKSLTRDDVQNPNYNNLGFFLSPVEADATLDTEISDPNKCILTTQNPDSVLFTFKDSGVQKVIFNKTTEHKLVSTVVNGGYYYLYFANCEDHLPVSFDSDIAMFNLDSHGRPDYLSVGETQLETVYWVMFSLFTTVCGIWCWYVWKCRQDSHRIHYLMGLLCAFKALTVMTQAGMDHVIRHTGHADGWNVAYYVFTFCRGVLFFTVVVLIGTGWSYMKPFLGDKEKRILMVVVPLQVFANIAIVITEEESPSVKDWFTWRDMFHLVDIICCCAILFPIVWSIKNLREASHTDGKAARNLEKLTLFRQFYVMVVVYIYFTRIVVYLLKNTMQSTPEYMWVSDAADQLATLAFYVWTAVKFRPHAANPYLKLEQAEIEL